MEEFNDNGILKGIYIKEKLKSGGNKIIIASKGELKQKEYGYNFELSNGKIINIDKTSSFNLGFKETIYELKNINFKTRKISKLGEIRSSFLIDCLKNNIKNRKDTKLRCGGENSFLMKDIYEEIFIRFINPTYILILSLISSLLILKPKNEKFEKFSKFMIFLFGFIIIVVSELSYKLINLGYQTEILSIILPAIFVIVFYLNILFKTNFRPRYL